MEFPTRATEAEEQSGLPRLDLDSHGAYERRHRGQHHQEQVVRDVFAKCSSSLYLDVKMNEHLAKGPGTPDRTKWHLWVSQSEGLETEIGYGASEPEMWQHAYILILTATAERWRGLTTKPPQIVAPTVEFEFSL